jgi:hypothetical protein
VAKITVVVVVVVVVMMMMMMMMMMMIPWNLALLEKPLIVQLLKMLTKFYETSRFITVFTRALHWSLS